jgi:hypothetical protein
MPFQFLNSVKECEVRLTKYNVIFRKPGDKESIASRGNHKALKEPYIFVSFFRMWKTIVNSGTRYEKHEYHKEGHNFTRSIIIRLLLKGEHWSEGVWRGYCLWATLTHTNALQLPIHNISEVEWMRRYKNGILTMRKKLLHHRFYVYRLAILFIHI